MFSWARPHEITSHFDSGNPSNHFSCLLPSDFQVSASFSLPHVLPSLLSVSELAEWTGWELDLTLPCCCLLGACSV